MCAYGVSNYSGYGRLSSISEKYIVCSPWFDTENDKDGLQKGLAELGAWYVEHLPEINFSYEKQQTWLDKDYRDAKITRAYLDEHLSELTEPEIFELYRTIDRLAGEYEKSDMKNRKNSLGYSVALSGFNDFCYGKFPPKINHWVDELSERMLSNKVVKDIDINNYPAILKHKEIWKYQ